MESKNSEPLYSKDGIVHFYPSLARLEMHNRVNHGALNCTDLPATWKSPVKTL